MATPADAKDKPDPNRAEAPVAGEKKFAECRGPLAAVRRIVEEENLDPAAIDRHAAKAAA